jgi:hypothetical protein
MTKTNDKNELKPNINILDSNTYICCLVILAVILTITTLVHVSCAHLITVLLSFTFRVFLVFSLINDKFSPGCGVLKIDTLKAACGTWMHKRLKIEVLEQRAAAGPGSGTEEWLHLNVSGPLGSRQPASVTKELVKDTINLLCSPHFRYLDTELGRLIRAKKGNLADGRDLLVITLSVVPPTVGIIYTRVKKYNGRG